MKATNAMTLNPRRTWRLVKNDVVANYKNAAIGLGAASGVILLLTVLTNIGGSSSAFHVPVYTNLLLIGGYIVASIAFVDLHDDRKGLHYLTLPGSLLEKYVGRVLLTSVGWAIVSTVAYMVVTLVGAGLAEWFFGSSHGVFVPSSSWSWNLIATYLVSQSIFVFGSIYFKKAAFLKTVLAIFVAVVVYAVFLALSARLIFFDSFARFIPTQTEMDALQTMLAPRALRYEAVLERIGDIVGWTLVPIFFWTAGYLRLRETEV